MLKAGAAEAWGRVQAGWYLGSGPMECVLIGRTHEISRVEILRLIWDGFLYFWLLGEIRNKFLCAENQSTERLVLV